MSKIKDYTPLFELKNLRKLEIEASLNNIDFVKKLSHLYSLNLNNNQIEDIQETINKNPLAKSMMATFKENMSIFKPLSARHGLSKEQALNKICNDFSFLESEEFKGIFDFDFKKNILELKSIPVF